MSLKKLLLGEEIHLNDDFFGRIESERTRSKTAKSLDWFFSAKIGNSKQKTEIIAQGNYQGIDTNQKTILKDFVENFDNIYSLKIDSLINSNKKHSKLSNWKADYYVSLINPDLNGSDNDFEIGFMSYKNKNDFFMIQLKNKELKNLQL